MSESPWRQWILDLRAAGLTDYKIALAIGYTHPKDIEAIVEHGRIPGGDKHLSLEALHNILCPVGHRSANVGSA